MLVEAKQRFANRMAAWLLRSKLDKTEIAIRLRLFSDDFVRLVDDEAKRIKNIK